MNFPKIWVICRVCLKQQDEMFHLFDDRIHKNIWSLLRDCGGVPVRKNDSFPDKICEACLTRLWHAMDFRIYCQRSHRELLQKQMKVNIFLYEEENKAQILKTSNSSSPNIAKAEQEIPIYAKEGEDKPLTEVNNDKDTVDQGSDQNIKQYCIVTRSTTKETNPKNSSESNSKQPIVLLLRLKNTFNESTQNETSDLKNFEINTKKTLRRTLKMNNDNIQLKNKIQKKIRTKNRALKKPELSQRKTRFICNICKKSYKTKELLRHHSYTHKKPHECKICHKKFSQTHCFLSHNNQHTGIKPYYCRICLETFSDITNRNCHERQRHSKQQYKCNDCNKSFRFLCLLEQHFNSHRPAKCLICNKEFSSVRIVRLHHKRKHLKILN